MIADERLRLIRTKIEWAKKHFEDLKAARNRFIEPQPDLVKSDPDPQTGDDVFKVVNVRTPPEDLGLMAGDVIHNLRSALDHLAYQLVIANGGMPSPQTCFPIFDTADKYKAMDVRKVKGMSKAAIDAIDKAKPYGGGTDGLYWLHKLDITDKHHNLIVTMVGIDGALLILERHRRPRFQLHNMRVPLKDGDIVLTCEPGFNENVNFVFDVAFTEPAVVEGKPIIELLDQITDLVDNLIVSFRPHLV